MSCKGSHKKGDFKEEDNCIKCCRTFRTEGDQETVNGFNGLEGKRLENSQVEWVVLLKCCSHKNPMRQWSFSILREQLKWRETSLDLCKSQSYGAPDYNSNLRLSF